MAALTVRVGDEAHHAAIVAWMPRDYSAIGYLKPDPDGPPGIVRGVVPRQPLELFAFDVGYVHGEANGVASAPAYEARSSVDLQTSSADVSIDGFVQRDVRVRRGEVKDGHGVVLRPLVGEVVLDGTFGAARDAALNMQRIGTDSAGQLRLLSASDEAPVVDLMIPLLEQPVRLRLALGARPVVLRDVSAVLCQVSATDGDAAHYQNLIARAERVGGQVIVYEPSRTDISHAGAIALAWARGTKRITAQVDSGASVTLRAPTDPCVLQLRP
jgi:hypothetical protein